MSRFNYQPIDRWTILISGFRQTKRHETGTELVWRRLRQFSEPTHCVVYASWRDDWKALAAHIQRCSTEQPIINIVAYSWGVGWGAVRLLNALESWGLRVCYLASCDGVSRSPYLPAIIPLNPLSLLSSRTIKVGNVAVVEWCRQRETRPYGHTIVARKGPRRMSTVEPRILAPSVIELPHTEIDRHQWFIATAVRHTSLVHQRQTPLFNYYSMGQPHATNRP